MGDRLDTMLPKISVAIATYNGRRYIEEQLLSIIGQSIPVFEIVIVDDASTDDTWQIIEGLAKASPITIRTLKAAKNQGSTQSFAQAVEACQGEWIALADQDDVWMPEKIATLMALISKNNWNAIFSDALIVDENLKYSGKYLLDNSRLTPKMRRAFCKGNGLASLLKYNVVTGATLMFQSRWKSLILPIEQGWIHDYWIALVIASSGLIGLCEEPLLVYRQHNQNQIGVKINLSKELNKAKVKPLGEYLEEARLFAVLTQRLENSPYSKSSSLEELNRKSLFLKDRYSLHSNIDQRLLLLLKNILHLRYFRYGQGWRPLLKDFLLP